MNALVDIRILPGWAGPKQTIKERRTVTEWNNEAYEVRHDQNWFYVDHEGDRTSQTYTDTTYSIEYEPVSRDVERDVDVGAIAIAFDDGTTGHPLRLIHEHAIPGDRLYYVRYTGGETRWNGCFNASTGCWMWHDQRVMGASDKARSMLGGALAEMLFDMSGRKPVMQPMTIGGFSMAEAILVRRERERVVLDIRGGRETVTETNALFDAMPDGALLVIAMPRISGGTMSVIAYALDPVTLREHVWSDRIPDRASSLAQDRSANGAALGLLALLTGMTLMLAPGIMSYAGIAIALCGMAASLKAVCQRGDAFTRYDMMERDHRERLDAIRRTRLVARRWTWRRLREGF